MYSSKLFFQTLRSTANEQEVISYNLMTRAGLIKKLAAGVYTWMPLGIRVLHKLSNLIKQELNSIGAQELLLPILQPATLWQETARWDQYGDLLFKVRDRNERNFCLGPTHEEVITDLVRNVVTSYKQLPVCLYQIQTKFRDEIRPRFGVMRAREFLMKDAYSFHLNENCLNNTYEQMFNAYCNIFNKLSLHYKPVLADNGDIGGQGSHEFQVIASSGEDQIIYSEHSNFAANVELNIAQSQSNEPIENLKIARGIEVGHIFKLGDRYSRSMQANILNNYGSTQPMFMGCYGIGVSRLIAACIEQKHDVNGIVWPELIAPFKAVIIPIGFNQSTKVKEYTINLYQQLQQQPSLNQEILLDDRNERPGYMFKDQELLGIPHRIVINEKLIERNQIEYQARNQTAPTIISHKQLYQILN